MGAEQDAGSGFLAGAAKVDITPGYPVRLSGYGGRRAESSGVTQRIWARALAISAEGDAPAILLAVENLAVPARVAGEVASRVERKAGVPRERFALASTHTHSAPMLHGICDTLFGEDIPPEHQKHIDVYTAELTDLLEKCALDALAARVPSRLAWGRGTASFAGNRRTKGGPVDHDLPLLRVIAPDGKTRAIVAGYACHCTALGGEFNEVCGDWAGYAAEAIEAESPGAVALVTIGCGGDADPYPRTGLDFAKQHGAEIAAEAKRLLGMELAPVTGKLEAKIRSIEIPFAPPPDRKEWEARAAKGGAVGYHARRQLARLDRGEALQTHVVYPVQTWSFGDDLAMVFLAGEVVVDYSLRLKRELDAARIWVTAYSNDVPCYIPSRRVLAEGGYEGGGAMIYYDRPGPFDPSVEDKIIDTALALVPESFRSGEMKAELPPPLSPEESRAAIRVKAGLQVELVAAEPMVIDPVAIDFGIDGALWVCEMNDYPMGLDGNWKPGGRVRRLEDTDGDGRYDRASLFLEDLPFPTGVLVWRKGVLVCAAPDIIFAEDKDGDGKADVRRVLFTGFETHNFQARVNGLSWGLDNWVYGACGLFGGKIRSLATGETIDLGGRDFRMNPDTGAFEPAAGTSQQGRVRDDWGRWFGNENASLLWHFPLPDPYTRRNPHVASPNPRVAVAAGEDPNRLFPASRTLRRFNDPDHVNRTTSACGACIYRDELLGKEYEGNAFVCEPVHNLVTRLVLESRGETFEGHRAEDEKRSEFLASKDSWFRPVQALTGPDGALWVVDMYRFVIEHPRWIPAERLAQLDVRAGADKGRIYRVVPAGAKPRPIRDWRSASARELAFALDSSSGPLRDILHRELAHRQDKSCVAPLEGLVRSNRPARARVQALCALDGLNAASDRLLRDSLRDSDPQVKAHSLRLSEARLSTSVDLQRGALELVKDSSSAVRFQLALSLGEWDDPRAGEALGSIAIAGLDDPWLRAAVFSSASRHAARILAAIRANAADTPARAELLSGLIATAAATSKPADLAKLVQVIAPAPGEPLTAGAIAALAGLLDAIGPGASEFAALAEAFVQARKIAGDAGAAEADRVAACRLLARGRAGLKEDFELLSSLLAPSTPPLLADAAVGALARSASAVAARILLEALPSVTPAVHGAALDALMGREEWIAKLLDALGAESIRPSDLDAAQRQKMAALADEALRARAEKLFAKLKPATRADAAAKYSAALSLAGDEARGAAVFARVCATCHAFRGQGRAVAPNLAALNDKGPQFLFNSILDPNAAVEPKYLSYAAVLRDGRVLTGIVGGESSNALTIVQPSGIEERVLRKDLASLASSGLSLMPEGLEQSMTPADFADLIAYVRGGPRALGSSSPAEEAAARDRFLDGGTSGFAEVVSAYDVFQQPSWLGRVTMRYCRQNDGKGKVVWRSQPVPAGLAPASSYSLRLAAAMGFSSQPQGNFTLTVNSRASLDFNVAIEDASWQSVDGRLRVIYTVLQNNAEDSTGVLVIEAQASLLEAGKPALVEVTGSAAGSERWFGVLVCPPNEAWKSNAPIAPIATVTRELYEKHPRPGAAALVSAWQTGPGLERMEIHSLEIRDDVPHEPARRHSEDNGRTWSALEPLPPTLSHPKGVEVWEGGGAKLFDPGAGVVIEVWLRQINLAGLYNNFTYARVSRDHGRTWSAPRQLRYEDGDDFDPADPVKPSFLGRNQAYFGSNILRLSNGTLLHAVAHANAPGDAQNDSRAWRMGSCLFLGTWDAAVADYRWTAGARVEISSERSSRGLMEPEAAELADGRVLVIWRGSDTPSTPGRKWFSVSADGGKTLGPVEELQYDDGSRFYSPSSYHRMIRHGVTGKLYWIGNISGVEPRGNWPRYPLVIAEVDETKPALRKSTVTAIDDRRPGQTDQVQYSNFSILEDRATHALELILTLYGETAESVFSADCYRYRLSFAGVR